MTASLFTDRPALFAAAVRLAACLLADHLSACTLARSDPPHIAGAARIDNEHVFVIDRHHSE